MTTPAGVSVDVVVELGRGLSGLDRSTLTRLLTGRIKDFLDYVGLHARPAVSLTEGKGRRPLGIRVHGALLPYPPGLFRRCWLVATLKRAEPSLSPPAPREGAGEGFPAEWLDERLAAEAPTTDGAELAHFVALVVLGVLRDRPSALLSDEVAAAYVGGALLDGGPTNEFVCEVLGTLLDLGVRVVNRRVILDALAERDQRTASDVAEHLVSTLRPNRVEIRVAGEYLASLGFSANGPYPVHPDDGSSEDMRTLERLLLADGFHVPDLFWAPAATPPGIVAVNVNGIPGAPARALDPDEYLVDRDVEWLTEQGIPHTRTLEYPLTGETFAVVHEREIVRVVGAGGNLMPPAVYLAFLVYRDLLARGDRLIAIDETLYDLWILRDYQPVLVESALRTLGVGVITRVRRALAAAGLPVKDLRLLLERLLEHAVADPAFTEAGLVEAARGSLARELASRRAIGDEPPVLIELDGDLIARLASGSELDEDEQERVRDRLWSELRNRRAPTTRTILRVPSQVVWSVHALLGPEFPKLAVLASDEVAGDGQAVATLSLT